MNYTGRTTLSKQPQQQVVRRVPTLWEERRTRAAERCWTFVAVAELETVAHGSGLGLSAFVVYLDWPGRNATANGRARSGPSLSKVVTSKRITVIYIVRVKAVSLNHKSLQRWEVGRGLP